MAGAMIQCLINRYLSDNAATDAISSRLREISPSLYSTEDAICSKVSVYYTAQRMPSAPRLVSFTVQHRGCHLLQG